jgi:hypothetical protein
MASKKNGSAQAETTVPATDTIPYDDAVSEGQAIVLKIAAAEAKAQLRLGELADNLELKYKDRTIAKFAAEIGIAKCTVDRYRTIYRSYKGILAPGPNLVLPSYAVLRELATHPDREQIIAKHPAITKREALAEMRKLNGKAQEAKEAEQEDNWLKHNRKWFKDLVTLAHEVSRVAVVPNEFTPEQQHNLLQVIEPVKVLNIRGAGNMLVRLADHLDELLDEAGEKLVPEGRVARPTDGLDGRAARL